MRNTWARVRREADAAWAAENGWLGIGNASYRVRYRSRKMRCRQAVAAARRANGAVQVAGLSFVRKAMKSDQPAL